MNVLHVIEGLDPKGGGPSVSCPSLACAQVPICEKVAILTYDLDKNTFHELGLPNQNQLLLYSIPSGRLEKLLGLRARREVRKLIRSYDVVHIHGVWSQLAAEACLAAKKANIPYVIAPRGMLDPWSLKQRWLKKQAALILRWGKILSGAHFIHALNEEEAELMSYLRLSAPIRVSPNGIFEEKIPEIRSADGSEYKDKYGEYILFMSRLHYKKGLDYLVEGYREYLDLGGAARLIIAGPDEGERHRVLESIRSMDLQNVVELIGPVYGQAKYKLLKAAKVFCLPSRQEGFSMAILEASAAGVPVVISKSCHFGKIAEVGAGDVTDLDAKSIGESLYKYADSESDAGERGAELVRTDYTWEAIAPKVVSWYR